MSSTFSMSRTIGSAPISSRSAACSVLRMTPRGLSPRSARSFSSRSPILPWPPTMTTFTGRQYPPSLAPRHAARIGSIRRGAVRLEEALMILGTAKVDDFDRFWQIFSTKGAELRKEHGSRGAQVFRDREDPNRVFAVFDWD